MPDKCFAAIDMGTNSFHLIIAAVSSDGKLKIIDREREVIRLGSQEGENLSIISDDEISRGVSILKKFNQMALKYGAEILAAATSAVRESSNRDAFIASVYRQTGIKINVIDGAKEAELIYKGAERALALHGKKVLTIDIGGGSSEFILTDKGKIIFAESVKIGAVRLSKKFFPGYALSEERLKLCEEYVEAQIKSNKNINFSEEYEFAVGTSGTIQSIARMIFSRKLSESINGLSFSGDDLEKISPLITGTRTLEERLKIKNIEEKRADILPAGLIILKKAFELFKISEMKISEYALREGLIIAHSFKS